MSVQRYDGPQAIRAERTDAGLLRVPARLTRTGVFTYHLADGTPYRELRHPEDVFHPDSLATLRGVPVVEGHPATIDPSNWAQYAKGDVRDDVTQDGTFVRATLAVNDQGTIGRIDAKDLVELSCGYMADVIPGKGVYNGEEYDARQTNIRYNHVGLGPANWGRAGNQVKVIMDGKDVIASPEIVDSAAAYTDPMELKEALEKLAALTVRHDAQAGEIASLRDKVAVLEQDKAAAAEKARKDAEDKAAQEKAAAEKVLTDRIAALEEKLSKVDGSSVAGEAARADAGDAADPVLAARQRFLDRAKGGK